MDTSTQRELDSFFREIVKELNEDNVAVFAGAGLSAAAGFVNWKGLLKDIAKDIGLDVEKEYDLVGLAQYHVNENGYNRSQLNKAILENFSKQAAPTENHKILSRLPIKTFWTTNYDKLIEDSLIEAGRNPDVKYTISHLVQTKPRRDSIVYKMHGDVDHPNDAILTKDDYENYHKKCDQFISTLSGDLITKTFIFIGFSFTDPNLDYILSRVRIAYKTDSRKHYCFLRKEQKLADEDPADFEYRVRKQELFRQDLKRFNISTLLVDEYTEITDSLSKLEKRYKSKTIFLSGAAKQYEPWDEAASLKFVHELSRSLIVHNNRIVSGFGLGVGSAVISGSLEEIYRKRLSISDSLILRPFPQTVHGEIPIAQVWHDYRNEMIAYAGVAIFLFGNKADPNDLSSTIPSDGMRKEFEIAISKGLYPIPIGLTGGMSSELWNEVNSNFEKYYPNHRNLQTSFQAFNERSTDPKSLIQKIVGFIAVLTNQ